MRKKGQMEIMGLMVIVILLTLGMFFIVSLKTQQPKREVKKTYDDNQLASNFIISFLKTDTGCNKHSMDDLIQDCAVADRLNCEGLSSCDYVTEKSNITLDRTLVNWGKKFRFEIEGLPNPMIIEEDCDLNQERDSGFQLISLYPYPGTVIIRLDICE